MTILRHFPDETNPSRVMVIRDVDAIGAILAGIDVHLARVPVAARALSGLDADVIEVLFSDLVSSVWSARKFQSHDVIAVDAAHPAADDLRSMFLEEHTHAEDEARYLVSGSGLFSFHAGTSVLALTVGAGDFVNVPAGLRHWFDMGPVPDFAALRFFNNEDGWIPHYTRDPIADRFPRHEVR